MGEERRMVQPFIFCKGRYQAELTGKRARDLKEFLNILKEIDRGALFYHIHHALLDRHFVPLEYPNDFAYWIADALHEPVLAEKLADIDLHELRDLDTLRSAIAKMVEDHIKQYGERGKARDGREFHFVKGISVTYPTKYQAKNLNEFLDCLRKTDTNPIFYHFIASLLLNDKTKSEDIVCNDFSMWILREIRDKELADKLDKLDPYGFANLDALKAEIIRTITSHIRRKK